MRGDEDNAVTSNEEHLRLATNGLGFFLIILLINAIYGLLHFAQHQVAMAIVSMKLALELSVASKLHKHDFVEEQTHKVQGLRHMASSVCVVGHYEIMSALL